MKVSLMINHKWIKQHVNLNFINHRNLVLSTSLNLYSVANWLCMAGFQIDIWRYGVKWQQFCVYYCNELGFVVPCYVAVISYSCSSGLLHWHRDNLFYLFFIVKINKYQGFTMPLHNHLVGLRNTVFKHNNNKQLQVLLSLENLSHFQLMLK